MLELYVVGGFSFVDDTEGGPTNILQIYDIPTRTWRLGARHPEELSSAWRTLVADGKLFLLNPNRLAMGIYFPQEDMWMHVALDRAWVRAFDSARFELGSDDYHECCECAHNGRVVIFYSDGAAFERSNHNGFWSRYKAAAPNVLRDYDKAKGDLAAFGSVLLG